MTRLFLTALAVCTCILIVFSQEKSITVDGLQRTYLLEKPTTKSEKLPLLIVLHGGFGSGKQAADSYGITPIAHQHGYAVAYPDGIGRDGALKIRTWNAGGCCGNAVKTNVDDVNFISSLIDKLIKEQNIHPDEVFVTGMSNGAMMAYRLACEIPEKIKAIAPVAGYVLPVKTCSSSVPIIHFHSKQDENVPLAGGKGKGPSGFSFPSLDEVISTWQEFNQCNMEETKHDGYTLVSSKGGKAPMQYYLTNDGGHSWPGAKDRPRRLADAPSKVIDANALMFEFFQSL